jgi:HNH endonuclease
MSSVHGKCAMRNCNSPPRSPGSKQCENHYRRNLRERRGVVHCSFAGCNGVVKAKGLCKRHWQFEAMRDPKRDRCAVAECERPTQARKYCSAHYHRLNRGLALTAPIKPHAAPGAGYVKDGYHLISNVPAHRLIMEQSLGRPLSAGETVHHKNGDRLDNRLVRGHELHCPGTCCNLELWSRRQPSGQRVSDKLRWARQLLAQYADSVFEEDHHPW